MSHLNRHTTIIIVLLLLGYGHTGFCAVKSVDDNMEARWSHYLAHDSGKSPIISFPYAHCFESAARKYDLPLTLLLAVARGESNFNPMAKSDRNCHGLMQIQWPGTARHLGIYRLSALYEPCTNIRAGAKYLRELLDRYNDNPHLALAAYNYGPSRIKKQTPANQIPEGAQWYSGYIFHHLKTIMHDTTAVAGKFKPAKPGTYRRQNRLALITFDQPFRANAYYQHLQKRAPQLKLDWYRIGMGRYQVVLLYADKQTLEFGQRKLKSLGVIVKGK
jgi:hypothetical protein